MELWSAILEYRPCIAETLESLDRTLGGIHSWMGMWQWASDLALQLQRWPAMAERGSEEFRRGHAIGRGGVAGLGMCRLPLFLKYKVSDAHSSGLLLRRIPRAQGTLGEFLVTLSFPGLTSDAGQVSLLS